MSTVHMKSSLVTGLTVTSLVLFMFAASAQEAPPDASRAIEWMMPAGEVNLSVRSVGLGPVLIMIHGGPQYSHHYMEDLERFAPSGLTVVTYDQRGVGSSSDSTPPARGLENHVADLEALRTGLGVERIHVLGHSWGGLIALAYAVAHPDKVLSVTLVDSIPPSRSSWDAAQGRFSQRLDALIAAGVVPSSPPVGVGDDCTPQARALLPVFLADPTTAPGDGLMRTTCHSHVAAETWATLGNFDLSPSLAALSVPVLIIHGSADPFGEEVPRELAAALTGASPNLVLLPDCGHFPWLECSVPFAAAFAPALGELIPPPEF